MTFNFSCTNNYGTWPENKICCDMRFKRCCMVVMGPQTTTHRPLGGYGPPEEEKQEIPDIFLEEDLNIPNLENPIEDVDLGDGTMVFRPETAPVLVELDSDSLCSTATSTSYLVANPEQCSTYFSCQSAGPGMFDYLATVLCFIFNSLCRQVDCQQEDLQFRNSFQSFGLSV